LFCLGAPGFYHVVVWINSFAIPAISGRNDGLTVFGSNTLSCLQSKGASYDPQQKNMLSIGGSLDVVIGNLCHDTLTDSEFVERQFNRMVLIGPNRPFVFEAPGDASLSKKPFDSRVLLALVYRLKYDGSI
jgi:hypothetical protein